MEKKLPENSKDEWAKLIGNKADKKNKLSSSDDVKTAEIFWIKQARQQMDKNIKDRKLQRLNPRLNEEGIYVVGSRCEKWIEMSYNNKEVILLPHSHRFYRLYVENIHNRDHHGVLSTASKVRARFWITKLLNMVKSIKSQCIICKKLDKTLSPQVMGKLPEERLKPAPPWYTTAINLFGPYTIKDEVMKRTRSKAYGVLFNCLATRAVREDPAPDYSADKFLMVFRRFVSIRGYPSKMYSDNGPQLVALSKELSKMTKEWDWVNLKAFGTIEGFEWNFTPADAP